MTPDEVELRRHLSDQLSEDLRFITIDCDLSQPVSKWFSLIFDRWAIEFDFMPGESYRLMIQIYPFDPEDLSGISLFHYSHGDDNTAAIVQFCPLKGSVNADGKMTWQAELELIESNQYSLAACLTRDIDLYIDDDDPVPSAWQEYQVNIGRISQDTWQPVPLT